MTEAERVAVRRRARDAADANGSGGAGHVLDQNGLAETLAHAIAQGADQCVGWTAGGEGNDDGNRVIWKILGREWAMPATSTAAAKAAPDNKRLISKKSFLLGSMAFPRPRATNAM